jgi:large subunit ribosomal protein L10
METHSSDAAILTEYRGLAVSDMTELRRALTKVGGDYKVYKNTLVRRASHDIGLDGLDALLTGPTAIAFVDGDVAQVAKVLRDFARTNPNLVVKGGLLGSNMLDAREAAALAELPSRDTLLAQFAGMLAAPMQQFASLLQAVPSKLAYGLSALIEERRKSEPEPEVEAVAPASAEATASAEPASDEASPAEEPVAEEPAATEEAVSAAETAPAEEGVVAEAPAAAEEAAVEDAPAEESAPVESAAADASPAAEDAPPAE